MRLRAWIAVVTLALLAGGAPLARAQEPPGPRATIAAFSDGAYPNATALVNVEDPSGADIEGLSAASFSITIDGKPTTVASADLAASKALPLDVLLLVDVSGSMAGPAIAGVRDAATAFVAGLAPDDRVAVTTFADDVTPLLDFTADREKTQAVISGLVAGGNTALYRATAGAALQIAASQADRRAVVLLSDGAQDGVPLTISREDALKAAAGAGVPFFTIGEGTAIDAEYLQALAGITRGRYLQAPNASDIESVYSGVGRLLRGQYAVAFDASAAKAAGSDVVLEVRVAGSVATATARYRPGAAFAPPPLRVEGLAEGEEVSGARTITVTGGAPAGGVTFNVDDVDVLRATTPPYAFTFDPSQFAAGSHTLRVSADVATHPLETSVTFTSVRTPSPGGGGVPTLSIAGVAAAALLVALAAGVLLRLRSMPPGAAAGSLERVVPFARREGGVDEPDASVDASPPKESIGEPKGVLLSREGSDLGVEYPVGGRPVSIGSAGTCGVRVDDPELSGEEARIWISKGRLMVHRMTRLSAMMVDGSSGGWQILDPGESFEVGGHRFEFRLLPTPRPESAPGDVPNVLRDPEPGRAHIAPPSSTGPMPMPEARRSPFSDMMPRSD
jgi:VWFA-related protein